MAPRALQSAVPAALRVVKAVTGKSLVVAIPLHSGTKTTSASSTAEPFTNSKILPTYDREFWRRFSYTPILLKISTVLRSLGLRQLNTGPGKIVFYHNNVIQLSDAISDLAKSLPTTLEELLDVAVEDMPLREEVANILNRHGDSIWGSGKERPWLLKACEGDVEYRKDLDFDSKTDDDVIRHYLRLWILIKAFNYTRNKIKPSARTVKADTDAYKASKKPKTLTGTQQNQDPRTEENERVHGVFVDDRTGNMGDSSSVHKSKSNTFQEKQASRVEAEIRKICCVKPTSKTNIQGERRTIVPIQKGKKVPGSSATQASPMSTRGSVQAAKSLEVGFRSKEHPTGTTAVDNLDSSDRDRIDATGAVHHGLALHSGLGHQSGKHAYTESTGSDSQKSRPSRSKTAKVLPEERSSWACSLCTQRNQACDRALPNCGNCLRYDVDCVYLEKRVPSGKQARRDSATEVREKLITQETENPTLLIAKDLPLDKYWDKKEWEVCYSHINKQEIFLATVRSLGMRVTPRYATSSSPTIEHFEALGKDIREISQKLSGAFSAAQLFRYAEDRKFVDKEIALLLETHPTIWSLASDRKKLLAPGEDVNYPNDLFFEHDEDQKFLRMHLHRWIFLVALKNCEQKQGLSTNVAPPLSFQFEDAEGSKDNSSEHELGNMPVFDTLGQDESATLPLDSDAFGLTNSKPDIYEPSHQKDLHDHADPREAGIDQLEALELDSGTKEKQQPPSNNSESLLASDSKSPPQRPTRQQRKRKIIDSENVVAQNASRPSKQPRNDHEHVTYPGHDLSALFVNYLENHSDPGFDEAVALGNLAQELLVLKQHVPIFHPKQSNKLMKAFLTVSFPAWLSYREDIVAIKRMHIATKTTEETSHRHQVVLERSRLATQLRQAHETFMQAGSAGMRPEEVVFQVMKLLMDEDGESENLTSIREGFESLEGELITLCDNLMKSGGAKWILGDFPPVSSLDGMKSF